MNLLIDHTQGSKVVDDFYFRPEEPLQIGNILEKLQNKIILSSTFKHLRIEDELTEWR
ncbi:MAG: hypothetical protein EZS28_038902, partial [Streblomastix strix]